MTTNKKKALEELARWLDIINKRVDKRGAIASLDKTDSVNEDNEQLSVSMFYKALPNDPTQHVMQIVKKTS